MTNRISAQAAAQREAARRATGEFGVQSHSAPVAFVDAFAADVDWLTDDEFASVMPLPEPEPEPDPLRGFPTEAARDLHDAVNAARDAIVAGNPYQAEPFVRAAGEQVVSRAEELAGITTDEVVARATERATTLEQEFATRIAQLDAERAALHDRVRAHRDLAYDLPPGSPESDIEYDTANTLLRQAIAVNDQRMATQAELRTTIEDALQADLRSLADGYEQALAEVRDMSGEVSVFTKTSQARARNAFIEGSRVYPKDWVDASNAGGEMMARQQKTRAHYSHTGGAKQTKHYLFRDNHATLVVPAGEQPPMFQHEPDPSDPRAAMWVPDDEAGPQQDGATRLRNAPIEYPRERWGYRSLHHRHELPEPKGRGWQWHASTKPWADGRGCWWRPKTYTGVDTSAGVAEIKTSAAKPRIAGVSDTFSTSVHELAHRSERMVPELRGLEQAWLARRWEEAGVADQAPRRLYPGWRGNREVGRDAGFVTPYVGKIYEASSDGRSSAEVLSVGMESLFGGEHGGLIGVRRSTPDLDHRAFVLGVLATAGHTARA